MPTYNDDEQPIYEDQPETSDLSRGEKLDMRVNYDCYAPHNFWVELRGLPRCGEDNGRVLGVDVVVILDISATMPSYEGRTNLQKTAMQFFISRLRPIDRLSVVVSLTNAQRLCPLRLMNTEEAKEDVELLVNYYIEAGPDTPRDIAACLREALQVLHDRTHSEGRKAAIMLLSGSDATEDAVEVPMGDVPLHVLALGGDFTPHVLKEIASKSDGGTFSILDLQEDAHCDSINNLRSAFSECLARLFTVTVQDLELILTPPMVKLDPGENQNDQGKTDCDVMEIVGIRSFCQTWCDSTAGTISISLGDLYCQETRKFSVEVFIGGKQLICQNYDESDPAAPRILYVYRYDESDPAAVLSITYSYSGCLEPYNIRTSVIPINLVTDVWRLEAAHIPKAHLRRVKKEKKIAEAHKGKFKSI